MNLQFTHWIATDYINVIATRTINNCRHYFENVSELTGRFVFTFIFVLETFSA